MKDKLEKEHIMAYVPYGIKVQYTGIINGKEISKYNSEWKKECDRILKEGGNFLDYPENNEPKEVLGLKIAPIKRVSLWDSYTMFEVGIKSQGLKNFYLGYAYNDIDFKLVLKPLSDLTKEDFKEELYQYYETLGIDVKLINYDSGNDNPFDMTLTVTYKMMGEVFTDVLINRGSTSETPYHIFCWLVENHLDVFGLIPKGLAVDINEIKS